MARAAFISEQVGATYTLRDPSRSWTGEKGFMPSQRLRDAVAERAIAGHTHNAPTSGARRGRMCPACGIMRSVSGHCDCNS